MNKCHSNLNWLNDTTPAINDTNLNYMDGCIDTIDDRVVTMDSTKLEAGNISTVIKNVSVNDATGVFTFTRYDNSTFTVDTMLEKVVTNFGFDETTQKLTITLEDGTTKQVDLSSFIKETEVEDSDTVALSLVNHKLKATIKGNSITDAEMQTQYLTDCQSARTTATTAATASNTTKLQSEGYAVGTQNGVEVDSSSPYYHNNAKYYSDRASGSSLSALTDVNLSSVSDGQALVYDSTSQKWVNGSVGGVITTNLLKPTLATTTTNGVTCTNNGDGTYTLNGTASANAIFDIALGFTFNGQVKMVGCPEGGTSNSYRLQASDLSNYGFNDYGSGVTFDGSLTTYRVRIWAYSGYTFNNVVIKPMLTTNLSATYDDFVAYTGSTGKLNSDVAEIRKGWELIGSAVGRNNVNIDTSKYNEFMVEQLRSSNGISVVYNISSSMLNATDKSFLGGHYFNSSNVYSCIVKGNSSYFRNSEFRFNFNDIITECTMTVYGKR